MNLQLSVFSCEYSFQKTYQLNNVFKMLLNFTISASTSSSGLTLAWMFVFFFPIQFSAASTRVVAWRPLCKFAEVKRCCLVLNLLWPISGLQSGTSGGGKKKVLSTVVETAQNIVTIDNVSHAKYHVPFKEIRRMNDVR